MVFLNILHSSYDFFRERFLLEVSYPKSWVRFLLGTISPVYVFSSIQMNVCILCLLYKYTCSNIYVNFFNDFRFDQNVLNLEVWYFKVHAISFINSFFLYSYSFRIHWHKAGTYNFFSHNIFINAERSCLLNMHSWFPMWKNKDEKKA